MAKLQKKKTETVSFVVNGTRLHIDAAAFKKGRAVPAPGAGDEQCEDCGHDIMYSAAVQDGAVVCYDCGARYAVERERPAASIRRKAR